MIRRHLHGRRVGVSLGLCWGLCFVALWIAWSGAAGAAPAAPCANKSPKLHTEAQWEQWLQTSLQGKERRLVQAVLLREARRLARSAVSGERSPGGAKARSQLRAYREAVRVYQLLLWRQAKRASLPLYRELALLHLGVARPWLAYRLWHTHFSATPGTKESRRLVWAFAKNAAAAGTTALPQRIRWLRLLLKVLPEDDSLQVPARIALAKALGLPHHTTPKAFRKGMALLREASQMASQKDAPEVLFLLARSALSHQRHKQALKHYKALTGWRVRLSEPQRFRLDFQRGVCHWRLGQYQRARRAWLQARVYAHSLRQWRLLSSQLYQLDRMLLSKYQASKHWKSASKQLQMMMKRYETQQPRLLYELGLVSLRLRRHTRAFAYWQLLLARFPYRREAQLARLQKARAYLLLLQQPKAALSLAKKIKSGPMKAAAMLLIKQFSKASKKKLSPALFWQIDAVLQKAQNPRRKSEPTAPAKVPKRLLSYQPSLSATTRPAAGTRPTSPSSQPAPQPLLVRVEADMTRLWQMSEVLAQATHKVTSYKLRSRWLAQAPLSPTLRARLIRKLVLGCLRWGQQKAGIKKVLLWRKRAAFWLRRLSCLPAQKHLLGVDGLLRLSLGMSTAAELKAKKGFLARWSAVLRSPRGARHKQMLPLLRLLVLKREAKGASLPGCSLRAFAALRLGRWHRAQGRWREAAAWFQRAAKHSSEASMHRELLTRSILALPPFTAIAPRSKQALLFHKQHLTQLRVTLRRIRLTSKLSLPTVRDPRLGQKGEKALQVASGQLRSQALGRWVLPGRFQSGPIQAFRVSLPALSAGVYVLHASGKRRLHWSAKPTQNDTKRADLSASSLLLVSSLVLRATRVAAGTWLLRTELGRRPVPARIALWSPRKRRWRWRKSMGQALIFGVKGPLMAVAVAGDHVAWKLPEAVLRQWLGRVTPATSQPTSKGQRACTPKEAVLWLKQEQERALKRAEKALERQ